MSAARLREAATVLRERAEAVPDGPWETGPWTDHAHESTPVVMGGAGCYIVAEAGGDDAAYIATMHPLVGLALADWLDAQASGLDWWADLNKRHGVMCDGCATCDRCAEMSLAAPNWDAPELSAFRLADLILGHQS